MTFGFFSEIEYPWALLSKEPHLTKCIVFIYTLSTKNFGAKIFGGNIFGGEIFGELFPDFSLNFGENG